MLHWVFDLDNTLVDSFPIFKRDIREVFAKVDVVIEEHQIDDAHRLHFVDFINKYVPAAKVPTVERLLIDNGVSRAQDIIPYDGVPEFLGALRAHGCHVSLWTAREMESASVILEKSGLARYFHRVVTRTCRPTTKPHPEGLEFLIGEALHPKDVTIMVGDHAMDVEGARNAGVKSVRAAWGIPVHEGETCLADYRFTRFEEFKVWGESLLRGRGG